LLQLQLGLLDLGFLGGLEFLGGLSLRLLLWIPSGLVNLEFLGDLVLRLPQWPLLGLVDLAILAHLVDRLDLCRLEHLEFLLGLADRSDPALPVSLEFPVDLVLRLLLSHLGFLGGLDLLEFLVDRLDLGFLAILEFLGDLDLRLLPLLLVSLGDLEHLADRLDLFLLVHLEFLGVPVSPSHQLLLFLLSLLSLQLSLSPRYLQLLPSHRLLLSVQVVHRMDLSLQSDLMAPLDHSVLLVLQKDQLHLLDQLLQLGL